MLQATIRTGRARCRALGPPGPGQETARGSGMVLDMLYLSEVIGKPVSDAAGEAFDAIADLVIFHGKEKFPRITGILLNGDRSRVARSEERRVGKEWRGGGWA